MRYSSTADKGTDHSILPVVQTGSEAHAVSDPKETGTACRYAEEVKF
jgi:hypothetical protein